MEEKDGKVQKVAATGKALTFQNEEA